MDEDKVVDNLRTIERALAGSHGVGVEACRAELEEWRQRERDKEFQVSVPTLESQKVFLTWCDRLGLKPYRRPKQRKTTVCVQLPDGFMNAVLWPRVEAMARMLEEETAAAVVRVVDRWSGHVEERPPKKQTEFFEKG